jgi:hypothetical protein
MASKVDHITALLSAAIWSLGNSNRLQRRSLLCAWSRSAAKADYKIAASLVGTHLVPDSRMRQRRRLSYPGRLHVR